MKKRFTKRAKLQYLQGKLPENLFPNTPLKQAERRHLLKSHSFIGGQGNGKERPLSYTIAREMGKVREIETPNGEMRWSEIDILEHGSPSANLLPTNLKIDNRGAGDSAIAAEWLTSVLHVKGAIGRQDRDKSSPLLQQIIERKKVRILYGNLSNREMDNIAQAAATMRGERYQNMFKLLESRLDVVLYRGSIFPSITVAQQWIRRGSIAVNGRVETVTARMLAPGDVIVPTANLLSSLSVREMEIINVGRDRDDGTRQSHSVFPDLSRRVSEAANRPTHIEVSYRSLSIVYLYHTQRVLLPATLDMAQARKAYTK